MTIQEYTLAVSRTRLRKAELKAEYLKWVHESQRGLVTDGAVSEASALKTKLDLDLALLDVEEARAAVSLAESDLKGSTYHASRV